MSWRRLLGVGALVAVIAAGCSDGDEPEGAEPAATAEASDGSTDTDAGSDSAEGGADEPDESEGADDTDGPGDDTAGDDAGGQGDDGEAADDDSPPADDDADAPDPDPTSTTVAPGTEPEPDGDGFDVDREFSPDSEAENFGPIGSTETTIPTDEGEISVGGGDVPELGETFPLPDGFEVQLSTEVEGEIGFSGRVDGEFDDLVAFFEDALPSAGYEIVERQVVDGVLSVLTLDGPLVGDVVVSQEPGGEGWSILVALAEL